MLHFQAGILNMHGRYIVSTTHLPRAREVPFNKRPLIRGIDTDLYGPGASFFTTQASMQFCSAFGSGTVVWPVACQAWHIAVTLP